MARRLNRAWFVRAGVVAVVCALPLIAVGSAQAAIAGGNPANGSQVPNLRSATTISTSPAIVQVCFDKALSSSSNVDTSSAAEYLWLDGYNSYEGNVLSPSNVGPTPSNPDCVNASFDTHGGQLDLGQFTAVTLAYGAVQTATGTTLSYADSVTLSSSTTHNGIEGLTTAPDLTGPATVSPATTAAPNDILFVFDQNVNTDSDPTSATDFSFVTAAGTVCPGVTSASAPQSPIVSGSDVTVYFGTSTACNVSNAVRAYVDSESVYSVSTNPIGNAIAQGMAMPNSGGQTNGPDLETATLNADGTSVTYNFDSAVSSSTVAASDFSVALSNGGYQDGSTSPAPTVSNNGTSVTVSFTDLSNYDEYATQAGVVPGAVTGASTGNDNTVGSAQIGGNPGAFARGFTTGPDAYAASFNSTSNTASLTFDQRVAGLGTSGTSTTVNDFPAGSSGYEDQVLLLNAAGNVVGAPTSVVIPAYPTPGPETVTMDIDPATMAQHPTQIALTPYAYPSGYNEYNDYGFETGLNQFGDWSDPGYSYYEDAYNIPQIVAATTTSAHLKAIKVTKKVHKAKKVKKTLKVKKVKKTLKRA